MVLAFYVARADNPKSTLCFVVRMRLHGGLHGLSLRVLAAQVSPSVKRVAGVHQTFADPTPPGGARD